MKVVSVKEVKTAISEMKSELIQFKTAAEEFMEDIKDVQPEEVTLDNDFEGGFDEGPKEDEFGEEGKEKEDEPKIETPQDAKKVLDEAKEDIQAVIDNIEGVVGQGEEEESKIAFKRMNDKYAKTLQTLSDSATKAIDDAKEALRHWAFLKKRIKKKEASLNITHPELKQVANTLEQMSLLDKILSKAGYVKKSALKSEATAVPPTGAKFTGDKWPNNKDPKEIEDRQWEAGANKFHKDRKWEDARTNPAVDQRLTTVDYSRSDEPFVNASYNNVGNYYDIFDSKSKKAFRFSFANAPDDMGPKTESGLKMFASKKFANAICEAVVERGIDAVRKEANGQYVNETIAKQAASDKGSTRKYYADAFGDASYAKELTSGKENDNMNIDYKPKDDKVQNSADHPEFGKAKDGTGKLSTQDETILKKKAQRALDISRMAAAAGIIAFDKPSVKKYAMDLMDKSDETIDTLESTFNDADLVNEAALKEATIPDADSGIVGNRLTAVTDPTGTSGTEGLDTNVSVDAKISKKASIVPQISASTEQLKVSNLFTTVESRLKEKGVNLKELRTARYRTS
jgi:hypothetical protein